MVGSGTRFFSGISVYTVRLANAVAARGHRVSMVTMRQLLPTRFYPGSSRVGAAISDMALDSRVRRFDGVDWYWLPSLLRALAFLGQRRPQFVVLQWWSATVLHSYVVLALAARLMRARVIVEFHEAIDTGEAQLGSVQRYLGLVAPLLLRLAGAFVVHSAFDRRLLEERYPLGRRPIVVIPHGPYEHYREEREEPRVPALRKAPADVLNLLFFGIIRPFKGLEDLVRAFDSIPEQEIWRYWLTVVGETWEGWTLPAELIEWSRYRDRITFVNRYVHDRELDAFVRGADAVVLPYHRSSMSGPLNVAMAYGLPVVVTEVGGLVEAASAYPGAVFVPPRDPDSLRSAIQRLPRTRDLTHRHPHSWERTAQQYEELFDLLQAGG